MFNSKLNKSVKRLNKQYLEFLKSGGNNSFSGDFVDYLKETYVEPKKSTPGLGFELQKLTRMGYLIRKSEDIEITSLDDIQPDIKKILKSKDSKRHKIKNTCEWFDLNTGTILLDDKSSQYLVEELETINTFLGRTVRAEEPYMTIHKLAKNKKSSDEINMRNIASGYFYRMAEEIYISHTNSQKILHSS